MPKKKVISAAVAAGVAVSAADGHWIANAEGYDADGVDIIETTPDFTGDDALFTFSDGPSEDDLIPEVLDATHPDDRGITIDYAQTYWGGGGGNGASKDSLSGGRVKGGNSVRGRGGNNITLDNGIKKGGKVKMKGQGAGNRAKGKKKKR